MLGMVKELYGSVILWRSSEHSRRAQRSPILIKKWLLLQQCITLYHTDITQSLHDLPKFFFLKTEPDHRVTVKLQRHDSPWVATWFDLLLPKERKLS